LFRTIIGQTTDGCDLGRRRAICKFNDAATDDKTRARCCWGTHTVGAMNSTGAYPPGQKPCGAGYCVDKAKGPECVRAMQNYCKTQFPFGSEDNAECWRWAKGQWPEGLDTFCRDVNGGNGIGILNESQCNAYVKTKESYGNLDNAVTAYCTSATGIANTAAGENICNCFGDAAPLGKSYDVDQRANLVCFSKKCYDTGYKRKDDIKKIDQQCPDLCLQLVNVKDVKTQGGDIVADLRCGGGQIDTQETKNIQDAQNEAIKNSTNVASSSTTGNRILILLGISAAVLILIGIIFALYFTLTEDDDSEETEASYSSEQIYPSQYEFEPPQQIY